jgi:hypothetical protein
MIQSQQPDFDFLMPRYPLFLFEAVAYMIRKTYAYPQQFILSSGFL